MFESLHRLLEVQAHVWSDGSLVFDGGANPLETSDVDAISAFVRHRADLGPKFGHRDDIELSTGSLLQVGADQARLVLLDMLRDEMRMFAPQRLDEESLATVVNTFFAEFDAPACFANFRGNGWTPVTRHTRDSFFAVVDGGRVGYWLTCDDE